MIATENPAQSITLYFREGSSDKVYQCGIESSGDLFVVNFAYGRRGSTMNTGTKTTSPVDYDTAKGIYDKLVREKTAKGYTPGENGTPYQHTEKADRVAPVALWVDELDKAFAGSKSSGATDGGTSSRVFGSFISWMQEKKSQVFIVATANDVSQLPPEMLRKGRFDELWFVDLPSQAERQAIWNIQIAKYRRDPKDFDVVQLARMTEGLTGSEIENVFVDALFIGFELNKEPTDLTVAQVLNEFVPLSKLMAEQITGLRNWAKGRVRLATSNQSAEPRLRQIAA